MLYTLAAAQTSQAQVLYGSIVGNVKDTSEALIAGASVTIANTGTGQSRETQTDETGAYNFPTVVPGTYQLKVSKEGFIAFTETAVSVAPDSVARLDVTLKVGGITETVTVTGAAAALQTDRSEVRAEVASAALENLPVPPGRNYQSLFVVMPGFTPPRAQYHSVPSNPAGALVFNVNGTDFSSNATKIDGADSLNVMMPHEAAYVPTLESIDTVNVVTNSFDAETGLAGGAAIYVQTKSGTNDLHGVLFENHSDQHLKAKNFFNPPGYVKPKLAFNEFGGGIGGPIKKDKLFYFGSYEATYDRESASLFTTVPTAAIRSGDMSGSANPIYDPLTGNLNGSNRTPFADNIVPAARISSISRKLVDLTPQPNLPGNLLINNYYANGSYLFDRKRADAKVNWNPGQKLTLFSRFGFLHFNMEDPQAFGPLGGPQISTAGGNPGHGYGETYSLTIGGTYTFSKTFIVDAYFGWLRTDTQLETPRMNEQLGLNYLGIPGTNGPKGYQGGWPQFSVNGYTDLGTPGNNYPYYRYDRSWSYVANFNWAQRRHDVRFGLDIARQDQNQVQAEGAYGGAQGGFAFVGGPTSILGGPSPNQFNSYATFLLGLPTTFGKATIIPDQFTTRLMMYSLYIRDRWVATPRLTISYGVRWEYFPLPTRADHGLEIYDPATNKTSICGYGSVPAACGISMSKKLFAPRVGLAYRASTTFVIRAGYGITNDPYPLARPFRVNYPDVLLQNFDPPNSYQPAGSLATGIPAAVAPDLGNGVIDTPGTYTMTTLLPGSFKQGYVQSWNFTLQKQLRYGFTAQAGYVATRSTDKWGYLNYNAGQIVGLGIAGQPLSQKFGRTAATTVVTPFGTGQYNALQARLERRFAQGLQIGANYTWSKAIGPNDNDDSAPSVNALPYFNLNRSVRGFDRTHNLQLTGTWDLPFGKGKRWVHQPGVASAILGDWRINSLAYFMSGTPFSVTASGTSLNMPGNTQPADLVKSNVQTLGGVGSGASFFDPLAFAPVTQARFGTAGFNLLRGPGVVDWDFSLFRAFSIKERFKLEFRAESFNFSNTPHFSNPGGNVSNMVLNPDGTVKNLAGYSQILSTVVLGRDFDERQFRFGLRLNF
jgi:hypothetical protein